MFSHKKTQGPGEADQSPLYKLSPAKLSVGAGLVLLCYGISGVSLGLVFLDSCPRHPLLSVWLVTMSLVTALLSLLLLGLPACTKRNTGNVTRAPVKPTRLTIALMFVSSLVSVMLVVTLISWLCVGTFWLAHSRIRLEVEQEAECSLTLLVIVGITVFLSWTGILSGLSNEQSLIFATKHQS